MGVDDAHTELMMQMDTREGEAFGINTRVIALHTSVISTPEKFLGISIGIAAISPKEDPNNMTQSNNSETADCTAAARPSVI